MQQTQISSVTVNQVERKFHVMKRSRSRAGQSGSMTRSDSTRREAIELEFQGAVLGVELLDIVRTEQWNSLTSGIKSRSRLIYWPVIQIQEILTIVTLEMMTACLKSKLKQ